MMGLGAKTTHTNLGIFDFGVKSMESVKKICCNIKVRLFNRSMQKHADNSGGFVTAKHVSVC